MKEISTNQQPIFNMLDVQTILEWCVMAAQEDKLDPGLSWINLEFHAAVSGSAKFHKWCKQRLEVMLSPFITSANQQNQTTATSQNVQLMSMVAAEVSKSIAPIFQNQANSSTTASGTGNTTSKSGEGKMYDDFEVAIVKGFCRVNNVNQLPPIWTLFQSTKNVDIL